MNIRETINLIEGWGYSPPPATSLPSPLELDLIQELKKCRHAFTTMTAVNLNKKSTARIRAIDNLLKLIEK